MMKTGTRLYIRNDDGSAYPWFDVDEVIALLTIEGEAVFLKDPDQVLVAGWSDPRHSLESYVDVIE